MKTVLSKSLRVAFFILLLNNGLFAQIPNGYYNDAEGKTGDELKVVLHNIIKEHTTISYQEIWSAFWSTDNKGDNVVWDMYSDGANYSYSYYSGSQCGEYEQEGDCYNREHAWPKSWFSGDEQTTPGRDLHHIFPTDGFVNYQRSSYPYGEVSNATWTSQNGSKLGTCKSALGYTGTVFEPIDEYKGDFARALMYMSVRYYGEDDDWGNSGMTNKSIIKDWAINMLLDWSDNDPVSQKEIDRNNVVYGIQGNRNPFIDHPEYAHIIWEEGWSGITYNIHCTSVQHGSIMAPSSAVEGTLVNLTATPDNGYSLYSYYVYKTGDINTIVYSGSGNTFTMPAYDVTVAASFVQPSYVKVTNTPADWSGEYLLVYENSVTSAYVWTGVDANNSYTERPITDYTIADGDMVSVIIAQMNGGYSIKINGGSNNGKYISGASNSNTISFGTSAKLNTIESESNGVKITSNTSVMRFNNDGSRFRYYKASTYSSQQPVQLYKKADYNSTPTHTIQFNPNGGIPSSYTQTVNEFEPTALQANIFTRQGYAFNGWNTAANGSGTSYFDGATVTLLNDLTLYAQWLPTYSITCTSVEHGSISASAEEAVEGTVITLTATPDAGYEFDNWIVTANNESIEVENNQFTMPAGDVTVSAVFVDAGQGFEQKYYLITDVSQLEVGRTYLIVYSSAGKAMSTTQNNNNRGAAEVSVNNGCISSIGDAVCELTLGGSTNAWTFFDAQWNNHTGGYLYAASSGSNYLKTQANNDANGQWSISIDSNGSATIVAQGSFTRNHLRYNPNNGAPIFSCYAYTSNMPKVELYVRSEEYEYTDDVSVASINSFDKHTIHSGATLRTNRVLGMNQCNNANHIILEDGAQFFHNVANLNATMKKVVAAYSGDGGWYTLATPFASYTPEGTMLSNSYDLYTYNESGDDEGKEWINYKSGAFGLASGQGYLYAHNPSTSLRMVGALNSGNYTQNVNLSYGNSDDNLRGFNLLGNPTAHEISYTKTDNVSDGYYYLSNSDNWVYTTDHIVPVARGFMVKVNAENQTVTLNPQTKRDESLEKGQYLCVNVGEEKAYVKLNEGVSMPLMDMMGKHSSLYFMSGRRPYVMLVRDGANAVDLCFEARQNGKQTLAVDIEGLNLDYLHLIDHKTGADVDLLATPSYVFDAKIGDYVSRFRLLFSASDDEEDGQETFAYYADGEIRLMVDTCIGASLQVIDLMGRIVLSVENLSENVSTTELTPGVYVLHLITKDAVRVQKIVVK